MKNILIIIMVLLFSVVAYAGDCCQDYEKDCCIVLKQQVETYKQARIAAFAEKDVRLRVEKFIVSANLARDIGNTYVTACHLNNAGSALIEDFKQKTDYMVEMKKISDMKPSEGKIAYIDDVKDKLRAEWPMLAEARDYLAEAKSLPQILCGTVIKSNIQFIDDVEKWME